MCRKRVPDGEICGVEPTELSPGPRNQHGVCDVQPNEDVSDSDVSDRHAVTDVFEVGTMS